MRKSIIPLILSVILFTTGCTNTKPEKMRI